MLDTIAITMVRWRGRLAFPPRMRESEAPAARRSRVQRSLEEGGATGTGAEEASPGPSCYSELFRSSTKAAIKALIILHSIVLCCILLCYDILRCITLYYLSYHVILHCCYVMFIMITI